MVSQTALRRATRTSSQASIRSAGRTGTIQRQQEQKTKELKTQLSDIETKLKNLEITDKSQIPENLRQYINIPEDYFQKVKDYKSAQEYQDAYNKVIEHYKKGKLWAVAGYGEGLQQQIAKDLIKQGYSPAKGGLLEQEQYKQRAETLKTLKDLGKIEFSGANIIDVSTGRPTNISYQTKQTINQLISQGKEIPSSLRSQVDNIIIETDTGKKKISSYQYNEYIKTGKVNALTPVKPTTDLEKETQRYQDSGYTYSQAKKLAEVSLSKGGVTYSPETATDILTGKYSSQKSSNIDLSKTKIITGYETPKKDIFFSDTSSKLVGSDIFGLGNTNISSRNNINLPTSILTGLSVGNVKDIQSGNIFSTISSMFYSGDKKAQETYSKELGGFVSASSTGTQSTATFRPLTIEESTAIQKTNYLGSIQGITTEVPLFFNKQIENIREIETIKNIRESDVIKNFKQWIENVDLEKYLPPKTNESSWLSPQGIKRGFDYLAEGTLWLGEQGSKALQTGADILGVNKSSSVYQTLFNTPSPISRETAKDIISSAYMFTAFEPLMRTGTAQQSEYVYDYQTQKFIKKSDLKAYLENLQVSGKTFKDVSAMSFNTKAERLRFLLKNLKNPNDATAVQKVLDLAKESYGADFIKEFILQEGLENVVKSVAETGATGMAISSIPKVSSQVLTTTRGVELKGINILGTGVSNLNPSRVRQTNWVNNEVLTNNKQQNKIKLNILSSLKNQQKEITEQKQGKNQLNLKALSLLSRLKTSQQLKIKKSLLNNSKKTKQSQQPKPTSKIKLTIPPIISQIGSKSQVKSKIESLGKAVFNVFARKGGQDIKIGEATTTEEASKLLGRTLTTKLRASGFVEEKESGRKLKFEELKLGTGFRKSKIDPFRAVELKQRRLKRGTQETSEIQFFRKNKNKKKGWF